MQRDVAGLVQLAADVGEREQQPHWAYGSEVCYENDPRVISESGGYLNLSVISNGKTFACKELDHSFYTKYIGGMAYSMGLNGTRTP